MNSTEPQGNTDIKVSVIMPIYNAYAYLRPAMDSVLDQTLREIEFICVDDGSTDNSLKLVKKYQKKDARIHIITESNVGPARARNNGLKRAQGEYVAFLDADDFFEPDLLEKLYERAKRDDLDIAIAKYDLYISKKSCFRANTENPQSSIYDNDVVTSKNEHPDEILQSTTGSAWNKLFRRSFIVEKELKFLKDVKMFEDVYFTMMALAFAERVGKVQEVLIHHRIYSEQSSAKMFKKHFAQVPEVYVKIKESLMKAGMYIPLTRGFLNLSVNRCYNVYNLLWDDAKEDFWNLLHDKYVEPLGWIGHPVPDFDRYELCEFCAGVQIYSHEKYQKLLAVGKAPTYNSADKLLSRLKRKKQMLSIWFALFRIQRRAKKKNKAKAKSKNTKK